MSSPDGGRKWTPEEELALRKACLSAVATGRSAQSVAAVLALKFGRSVGSVRSKIDNLRLTRTAAALAHQYRETP